MSAASVDLDSLIDGQRVRATTIGFLAIATLAMFSDGFDLSAIGFVAPEVVKQWHLAPGEFARVFSAGIIGLLIGAPALGFLGDRIGRKRTVLIGLGVVGAFTLATMAAATLTQFVVLRFLAGIGLGGIIPNIIALTAEIAPKRLRGMFIVIVNFGVPAGIALPGLVAAGLVPRFGWPVLLLIGGVLPLAIGVLAAAVMPESIRFLARRGDRPDQVVRLARALRPDLALPPGTRFTTTHGLAVASGSPRGLFAGGLAGITPVLWLALAANQMTNFFSLSWLPTLLQSAGASTAQAGVSASLFAIGGIVGGLCLTFIIDRLGVIPMVVLFVIGVPLVALIGMTDLPPLLHNAVIAGAGFCVTGVNFSMGATLGSLYATPVRSLGTGWAQAMGRLGSLAAPIIGGVLLGMNLTLQELLFAPAGALAIGAVASVVLAVLCVRRFGGYRLDDHATARAGAIAPAPARTPLTTAGDLP